MMYFEITAFIVAFMTWLLFIVLVIFSLGYFMRAAKFFRSMEEQSSEIVALLIEVHKPAS